MEKKNNKNNRNDKNDTENKKESNNNIKVYKKKIDDNFLFDFEKEQNNILKKYNIKYYIIKKNKIVELEQKEQKEK